MKLRDTAAGALAAWQAMTMTTPGPSAPIAPMVPEAGAVAAWRDMTMAPPAAALTPAPMTREAPPPGREGNFSKPVTGEYPSMGPASTPLVDNPTQLPDFGPGVPPPAMVPEPPPAVAEIPPPTEQDLRALTVDEKRFAQGNALLGAAYQQGYAVAPYLGVAGMKPILGDTKQPGIRRDGYTLVASESFDNGKGLFSRAWGPGVVEGPGYIEMHRDPTGQERDSGAMVPPTGREAGYSYGLYTFDMEMGGAQAPGPYALLWPGTDVWPGPEMDLVERLAGGGLYSTLHWNEGGANATSSIGMDGVEGNQRHTYQFDWQRSGLSVYVDGQYHGTFTNNVPLAAKDGGENAAPGVGMQTWWSTGAQSGDNMLRLFGFSYEAAP